MQHIILLFACFYLTFLVNVSAQNVAGSVEVGVYSAYQPGDYTGSLPIGDANSIKSYPTFEGRSYSTTTIGGMIEYHFGTVFSLVGILRYENPSVYLTVPGERNIYRASDSSVHEFDSEYTCTVDVQAITTSFLGKTTIPGSNVSILMGANISVVTSNSQEIQFYLYPEIEYPITIDSLPNLVPDNIHGQSHRFLNDSRTSMTIYRGEIDNNSNTFLVGVSLGLQYDIPLCTISESEKKYITLTPTILAHRGISKISTSNYAFRLNSINFGLALKVSL